jgi:hypothetical protein
MSSAGRDRSNATVSEWDRADRLHIGIIRTYPVEKGDKGRYQSGRSRARIRLQQQDERRQWGEQDHAFSVELRIVELNMSWPTTRTEIRDKRRN